MPHLSLHQIGDVVVYWGFFWNTVYALSPPREWFHSPRYNKFLDIVSYYGALNVRSLLMKAYQAPPPEEPAVKP